MKKILVWPSVILGVLFIALAIFYWMTPAGSLPTYMPGYEAASTHIHLKHGIAALILGLALFVFAWFKSGKKQS